MNYNQIDWPNWLLITDFIYNNSKHAITDKSLFKTVYIYYLTPPGIDINKGPVSHLLNKAVIKKTDQLAIIQEQVAEAIIKVNKAYIKYYNRKYILTKFYIRQLVWLSIKNLLIY